MTEYLPVERGKKPDPSDVQALFDAGYSRNRIAAQLEVTTYAVNVVARELGITFNQELMNIRGHKSR